VTIEPSPKLDSPKHRVAKLLMALGASSVLVFTLVLPGWSAANRAGLTPTDTSGLVALVVPVAPGNGSATLTLSTGTLGSSTRTSLNIFVKINEEDELTNQITLLMAGDIRNSIGACTGKISVERDILYENLGASQGAALAGLRRDYSRSEPAPNGTYTFVRDSTILKNYENVRYTLISFSSERSDEEKLNTNGSKDTFAYRQVSAECELDLQPNWTESGPQSRFSLPQLGVWVPNHDENAHPQRFQIDPSLNLAIATGSSISLQRNNLTPSENTPNSVKWSFSNQTSDHTVRWSYSSGDREDSLYLANPVSVVFTDSEAERHESATIYRSGVGLGIAGSLVAWMLPEIYDLIAMGAIRRRRDPEATGSSTATDMSSEVDSDTQE